MSENNQTQLGKTLWKIADELRGAMNADDFRDSFKDEILRLVKQKAEAGEVQSVEKVESPGAAKPGAEIIDLTELLKRSLQGGGKASAKDQEPDDAEPKAPAKAKAPRKRA